jgi:hypothetical protein
MDEALEERASSLQRSRREPALQPGSETVWTSRLALPDDKHAPAHPAELAPGALVACLILPELLHPELLACLRCIREPASPMAMPEAPVNEHNGAMPGQDNVRRPRQVPTVQPEAISEPVQQ